MALSASTWDSLRAGGGPRSGKPRPQAERQLSGSGQGGGLCGGKLWRQNALVWLMLFITVLFPIVHFSSSSHWAPVFSPISDFVDEGFSTELSKDLKGLLGLGYTEDIRDAKEDLLLQTPEIEVTLKQEIYYNKSNEVDTIQSTEDSDVNGYQKTMNATQFHQQEINLRKVNPGKRRLTDARLRQLQDQLAVAKFYLKVEATQSHSQFISELQNRVTDAENIIQGAITDSDLPDGAYDILKTMEETVSKGKQIIDDCVSMEKTLRAGLRSTERQLQAEMKETHFLSQLLAKTLPKGLHCLPLRLSIEYYKLNSTQRNKLSDPQKLEDPKLYHYALFSDNVLAAAVVVNSTLLHAENPGNHVFHVITDALNFAAMKMWFLSNPIGNANIQVQKVEEFTWLNSSYSPVLKQLESESMIDYYFRTHGAKPDGNLKYRNPKYLSILNHLRFYLPEIFPKLNKVVFLDDDIVVQKDLSRLWDIDLKGKINAAVETCGKSFHRFDKYLNFSNPLISKNFDPHACGWAYGMNVFDLAKWRKQNITDVYHSWQNLNNDRQLWKLGTLPPGLITFYERTLPLNKSWHVLGLGYDKDVKQRDIERAAVIHYNGNKKPWLDIAMAKYRGYWTKYVNYDQQYLRHCNIIL